MTDERMTILEKLRNGEISADEAEKQLSTLGTETYQTDFEDNKVVIVPTGDNEGITRDENIREFNNFWEAITVAGVGILVIFGGLLTAISGFFAMLCFGPFALIGGVIAAIGLWSRGGHWIHVRVKSGTDNINISLPFPLGFASTIIGFIEPYIERYVDDVDLKALDLASMLRVMGDELSEENPLMVAVDDDDDQVLVYIT